jgi:hypothetical protein
MVYVTGQNNCLLSLGPFGFKPGNTVARTEGARVRADPVGQTLSLGRFGVSGKYGGATAPKFWPCSRFNI